MSLTYYLRCRGRVSVKAYVITTGVIFGLITVTHLARMIVEPHLATSPGYILLTSLAAALAIWSWRVA
jgi:hypothetical protein